MRKLSLMLLVLATAVITHAQIGVTVTGNTNTTPNLAASYPSLAAAITDLNAVTAMTGPVVLNLAAGGTETAPAGGYLLGSSTLNAVLSSTNTITFQKNGAGANPLITAFTGTSTTVDGIFKITGADYIIIDALDLQEDAANTTNTTSMEWGYALVKLQSTAPFDGCQNIIIRNCSISLSLSNTNTYAVYSGNHIATSTTSLSLTAASDANSNNKFYSNTISACSGFRMAGFADASPHALYDQNNEIGVDGANTITDYAAGSATAYGCYAIYQNNLKFNNNSVTGGTAHTSTQYGVFISTCLQSNIDVIGNTFTLTNASTTSQVVGIGFSMGTTAGTSNTVNVSNNSIRIDRPSATSGVTYFIYSTSNYPFNFNISNNTIGNNSTLAGTGAVYGFYNISNPSNINITGNTVSNITRLGTTSTALFYGISSPSGTVDNLMITGNTIHSLTGNGSTGVVGGINAGGTTYTTTTLYGNRIYNITSDNAGGVVYGINAGASTTTNIYNNLIGDLKAPSTSSTSSVVRGINLSATSTNREIFVSYNTIHLDASSTGANFSTSGIYHTGSATATTSNLTLRNNIIHNNSVASGTGVIAAYERSNTNFENYNVASGRNIFYGGVPSASQLIYYDGTNSAQTLAAYQGLTGGADASSYSQNTSFQSTTGSSTDFLKYNTVTASLAESGAANIAGITDDYAGTIRQGNPGYAGTGTAPDVGAWELEGTAPAGCTGTPAASNALTTNATPCNGESFTLSLSTMYGVGYAYQWEESTTGAGGPFTTITGANTASHVTSASVTTWYRCVITCTNSMISTNSAAVQVTLAAPMAGAYTIDNTGAGNYLSFATAIADLNCRGISAPVTFNVVAGQTFAETTDLICTYTGTAANTITFQRSGAGANPKIQRAGTTSTSNFIINLLGVDYYTFDGIDLEQTGTAAADWVEYGFWISNSDATNGAQHNTIKNGVISLTNETSNARGVFMNQSPSASSADGTNSNNRFLNMTVNNSYVGYYFTGASANLDDNNEINTESGGSSIIQNLGNGTVTGSLYGVFSTYQTNLKVMNTEIMNLNQGGTSLMYGITCQTSASNSAEIANNHIHNFTGSGTMYGIYFSSMSMASVHDNRIHNFTNNSATSASVKGIYVTATGSDVDIYNNRVYNLLSNGLTTTTVAGIEVATGLVFDIYNNMVSDLKAPSSTTTTGGTRGISVSGGSTGGVVRLYNNTIYLDDVGAVAGYTSAGIHNSSTTPTLDIRNNIVMNKSNIATGTRVAAFWKTSTTLNLDNASNNNIYYGGTPGTGNLIFYNGTNSAQTIAEYQALVGPAEASAVTENTAFQPVANGILRPDATIPTYAESGAQPIAGLTTDFEGDTRNATTPDIGADEGSFTIFIPPPPGCATYTGPADGTMGICPYAALSLTWTAPTTGGPVTQGYDVYFGTNPAPPFVTNTSSLSYNVPSLLPNTTYYWQIVPKNAAGGATGCPVFSFMTDNVGVTSVTPGSNCGTGPVTLGATGNGTLTWYDVITGGTALATGGTFITPSISTTTTYYVSASSGLTSGTVGPLDNTIGTISSSNIAIGTQRMYFDVLAPTTLVSVDIYPTAAIGSNGSVTIRDNTQAVIADIPYTTTVTGGALQVVPMNVVLAPGTGYEMGQGTAIQLNRNTTGAVYPYTSSAINITGNSFDPVYYYFFYNWQFLAGCESGRTPVTATINPLPSLFNVTGGGNYCTGGAGLPVGLDGSETGVNYQLQLNSVNTGSPVAGTGAAISFGNQTAAGTYTVVATNATTLCTADMTGSAVINITAGPNQFNVTGGGSYCAGGAGVPVGLDGSELNVNYQLQLNSVDIGAPVAGTGAAISFGNQAAAGVYTVIGTNTILMCSGPMNGSVSVTVDPLPAAFAVTGGGGYCPGGSGVSVGLSGSETGVNYQLQINSVNAGAPIPGTGAALDFGLQTTTGTYTVVATNTTTLCTNTMTGSVAVSVNPLPVIGFTVTEPTTCLSADGGINLTITGAAGPYTFTWTTTDGSGIVPGAEDQSTLTVGEYLVTVIAANGCQASETITLVGPGGCFVCPTMASLTTTPASGCVGDNVTLTASGLTSMGSVFGIEFKYSTSPLADPYSGGTTIAVVPNGGLTSGGTVASTVTSFASTGTYHLYAILSPVPMQPACRPFVTYDLTVNQAPVITLCPSNITVSNDPGQCGAIVNYPPATASGVPAPVITYSTASGSLFPVGTTTVTVTATNACGSVQCTFTVTVNDTENPSLGGGGGGGLVPELLYYKFDGSGTSVTNGASAPPAGTATATIVGGQTQGAPALCGTGSLIGNGLTSTSNYLNTGWTTNLTGSSWTISFKTSNIPSSATLFYIFGDNTAGSFRCFTNGVAGANNWMIRGGFTDVIVPGGATAAPHTTTFVYDQPAGVIRGYLDGVLVTTVSQAAVNIAGSGPFKVGGYAANTGLPAGGLMDEFSLFNRALSPAEVLQLASCPSAGPSNCPAPIVVSNTPGTCGATVTFANPVATDNCPGVTVTQTGGPVSGSVFPVGTTTITFTATDAAGNTATCSSTVTVNDTEAPVVTCPANITVGNTPGQCGAFVSFTPTATDNCPGVTVSSVPASGSLFPVGTTTVTVTATDAAGNTATCTFTVTVNDTQGPIFGAPSLVPELLYYKFDGTGTNVPNLASAPPAGTNTATITGGQTQGAPAICGSGSLVGNGGSSSTNFVNTGWVTSFSGSWTISFKSSNIPSSATLFYVFGDNTAGNFRCFTNGVAGANNWMLRGTGLTDIIVPGGATTATHTTTFVYDQGAGVIRGYLDGALVVTVTQGTFTTTGTGPFKVGAQGANTGLPGGGLLDEFALFSRALSATEVAELANCPVTASTCPGPIVVGNDPGVCGAVVTYTVPTASDNCPGTVTVTQTAGLPSGSVFPVGTTTNTFTATDGAGNTATCSFDVTVNDTQAPTISCPSNITVTATGSCSAVVNYTVTATDNCPGTVTTTLVSGPASGSAFPIGTTTVTWNATDAAGNVSATCSFTVTVIDGQLPVISAQPANQTVCEGSNATFSVTVSNALSYQWQAFNGTTWNNIAGATAASYTVSNVTTGMNTNSYRVIITGACATVTSAHASLFVNTLPQIQLNAFPAHQLLPGQSTTLTATGVPPGGSYTWFLNGVQIPGASGNSLPGVTVDDAGTYSVLYTDQNGCSRTSANLVITATASTNLYVYPNPNNGQFTIRFYNSANEQATVNVYDAKGARVYSRRLQTTIPYSTLNVTLDGRFSAGGYLVEVVNAAGDRIGARWIVVTR